MLDDQPQEFYTGNRSVLVMLGQETHLEGGDDCCQTHLIVLQSIKKLLISSLINLLAFSVVNRPEAAQHIACRIRQGDQAILVCGYAPVDVRH
jgi:hypothetical protein